MIRRNASGQQEIAPGAAGPVLGSAAMMRNDNLLVLAVALATAACGDDGDTGIPDSCNPLGGEGCLLPWPSMAYATEDSSTPTGFRLQIPREAMPINADDIVVEPDFQNRWDGFSA